MPYSPHPKIQALTESFVKDLCAAVQASIFEELEDRGWRLGDRPATRNASVRRRRPVLKKAAHSVRSANGLKKEYFPPVSPVVKSQVLEGLKNHLGTSLTSREIADYLGLADTTVRVALKHLVREGSASFVYVGKRKVYLAED